MSEILTIECPFCKQEAVKVLHIEESFSTKRTRIRAGRNTRYIKNPEKNEIISGCSNCGKTKEEIEKYFKGENKPLSKEERIKRLKEAGLPLKIKG